MWQEGKPQGNSNILFKTKKYKSDMNVLVEDIEVQNSTAETLTSSSIQDISDQTEKRPRKMLSDQVSSANQTKKLRRNISEHMLGSGSIKNVQEFTIRLPSLTKTGSTQRTKSTCFFATNNQLNAETSVGSMTKHETEQKSNERGGSYICHK